MEPQAEKRIEWHAHEHYPFEHSADWFWALGIIAIASTATAIIFGNILFGILILMAGIAMGILARKTPYESHFILTPRALIIDSAKYAVSDLKAFWIHEDRETPLLLVDTPRFMTPDLVIPLNGVNHEAVREWFLAHNIPQKELHEGFALKLLETLGF